ncbi:hypothetical protein Bealeia1_00315 [Candidatus Bealeia paramacronuclearis]|uniref:Uncharacterized protein n=1 Tax=Candidatus Bealeia paramacronuclearis TaxID=1921001 RepID=A0ABZ2C1J9_9PROT|nr:hypothetical protein [Candidatus Bealeia paramacronuclearis]
MTVGNVNAEDVQKYLEQQEEHHKKMTLEFQNSSVYALFFFASVYQNTGFSR